MTSDNASPEQPKEKLTKVCPYLGLLQDSQTALSFPSGSNLCYHAKPMASPSMEYQRLVCLNGRRHTLCPVFTRSELAPLPPEVIGSSANIMFLGKPVRKRLLLPILIGIVVLILAGIGLWWFLNNHASRNPVLPGIAASATPTASTLPLTTEPFSVTVIPITPNIDLTATPFTDTPFDSVNATGTAQALLTPSLAGITPLPIHTLAECGSPNTWVVYIVRPGDTLSGLSLRYRVTVAELQRANCLGSSSVLHTGQLLYVPPTAPVYPTPTQPILLLPTFTPSDTQIIIPPTDTATPPPVDTATEIPTVVTATEVPTDTSVSP
jgi:LysM domain